jgi:hypothetical protein
VTKDLEETAPWQQPVEGKQYLSTGVMFEISCSDHLLATEPLVNTKTEKERRRSSVWSLSNKEQRRGSIMKIFRKGSVDEETLEKPQVE